MTGVRPGIATALPYNPETIYEIAFDYVDPSTRIGRDLIWDVSIG